MQPITIGGKTQGEIRACFNKVKKNQKGSVNVTAMQSFINSSFARERLCEDRKKFIEEVVVLKTSDQVKAFQKKNTDNLNKVQSVFNSSAPGNEKLKLKEKIDLLEWQKIILHYYAASLNQPYVDLAPHANLDPTLSDAQKNKALQKLVKTGENAPAKKAALKAQLKLAEDERDKLKRENRSIISLLSNMLSWFWTGITRIPGAIYDAYRY